MEEEESSADVNGVSGLILVGIIICILLLFICSSLKWSVSASTSQSEEHHQIRSRHNPGQP